MHLIPRELDKLTIAHLGHLAQRRLSRGIRLNHAEAALIRDGHYAVADLMSLGRSILGQRHVLPSVWFTLRQLQVEGTFPTGTYLVTVQHPIAGEEGDLAKALYGSGLPMPPSDPFPSSVPADYDEEKAPGAIVLLKGKDGKPVPITLNEGRTRRCLEVTNCGSRPIQVGSHYHFIETNPKLLFNRIHSYGYRLDKPAGAPVRFEPGEKKVVNLVEIAGHRIIQGGNWIAPGKVDPGNIKEIEDRLRSKGFCHVDRPVTLPVPEPCVMEREKYCEMFGPTEGDLVRLGLTNLWVEVENDYRKSKYYGDECNFGGGKTIRDGMGQTSNGSSRGEKGYTCADTVITNALIIDHSGIFKADISIKDGKISGIGRAGNPDTMNDIDDGIIIGANTDVIAGENKIVTAGGIDTHIHFLDPGQVVEGLCNGLTTFLDGGTGPSTGSNATTCTPGPENIKRMIEACDDLPVNIGITGKGNNSCAEGLEEQILAGAVGLKIHEDWGATPAVIKQCLVVCDKYDVQCMIHTDTMNESGFVDQTLEAIGDRVIHTYHTEGAGGGHAPDIIRVIEHSNVLPASTNPTRPYTLNTVDEHLDMVMVAHHLSKEISEDVSFAESRIRAETIAAEDVLHEGQLPEDRKKYAHDVRVNNYRVNRYVSKYTINPAIAQGMSHLIRSVEKNKVANLVIWSPSSFGTKPLQVLKSGMITVSLGGDPNGSIPTIEPMMMRPQFAPHVPRTSIMFVSQASKEKVKNEYGLKKTIEAVKHCRTVDTKQIQPTPKPDPVPLSKKHMKYNSEMPKLEVDPETFTVKADGEVCDVAPATALPLTQDYYILRFRNRGYALSSVQM
ncbi:amidohydrolase family protein [Aspergillus udagawae]|nr:amidohydrolase family protein [Aspergillus udagawae]